MRSADRLVAAARAAGLELEQLGRLGDFVTGRFVFDDADPWAAARFLEELATEDALDPQVRAAAYRILRAAGDALGVRGPTVTPALVDAFGEAIHATVKDAIYFVHEPDETFQSALATLELGAGDCDDHARLVLALALAGGLEAEMLFLTEPTSGDPVHAVVRIRDGQGMWRWAETTIDAEYGEEPIAALGRLQTTGRASPLSHVTGLGQLAAARMGALDFATPGDVLAYRALWDPYVMGMARALSACAATQTDASIAQGLSLDAGSLVTLWNLYAGWSDEDVLIDAPNILTSYQHTVMKAGTQYLGQLQLYCPGVAGPPIPTADAQTQVIARLEGLAVVAHGVLQLLGQGVGGALATLGAVAQTATAPGTWDTVKSLAYAGVAIAASYAAVEIARTVRAPR